MAKPELGTKRLCASCGAKFYDLNKDPIHCPKCGTVYEVAPVVTRGRGRRPRRSPPRPAPVEEVVGARAAGGRNRFARGGRRRGVRRQEAGGRRRPRSKRKKSRSTRPSDDDDTFIEEQEEEDADVTDIIGGDIENEEEG